MWETKLSINDCGREGGSSEPRHFESHRFQLYFGCDTDYCAFATWISGHILVETGMSSFPQVLKLGNLIGILFWEKRIAKWGHGWMADVWKSLRAICFHLQCIPSPFGVYAIWRPVQSQDSRGESAGNQFDYSASCCPLKIGVHNVSQCWLQYYCHVKLSVFHCHRKETLCIFLQKKCECEFHPTQVGTTGFVTSVGLPWT